MVCWAGHGTYEDSKSFFPDCLLRSLMHTSPVWLNDTSRTTFQRQCLVLEPPPQRALFQITFSRWVSTSVYNDQVTNSVNLDFSQSIQNCIPSFCYLPCCLPCKLHGCLQSLVARKQGSQTVQGRREDTNIHFYYKSTCFFFLSKE